MALGERGAEPAHQRAAAGVAGEWGAAFARALGEAEELGVERIGEVFAERRGAGDGAGGVAQWSAEASEELLPCGFAAESAGLGKREIGELERAKKLLLLSGSGERAGRKTEVVLRADGGERVGELGWSEGIFGGEGLELGMKRGWNGGCEENGRGFGGEGEIAGLRGGRVHGEFG